MRTRGYRFLQALRGGVLRETLGAAIDLFYPPHCANCEARVESGKLLCVDCRKLAIKVAPPRCAVCSHPFYGKAGVVTCPNCRGSRFAFEFAVACYRATGVVREFIHRLKYSGEMYLAKQLGEWICEGLDDVRLSDRPLDGIVPVPLHPVRLREREFNQCDLLAARLAERCGAPVRPVLRRSRRTGTQTQLDRRQRMLNLRDAFAMRHNADVSDMNLLLVDDVLTTGSTLHECSRVLLGAGARSVCAITVARG